MRCKGEYVTIRVPEKKLSQMLGQKRRNVTWLKERFHLGALEVCPDPEITDLVIETDPYGALIDGLWSRFPPKA